MKNMTFFLFLVSSFVFGQLYTKDELVNTEKGYSSLIKKIELKNGVDDSVSLSFTLDGYYDQLIKVDPKLVSEMTDKTSSDAKYSLVNRSTYRPLSVRVTLDDLRWLVWIDYSGQNDYGATKDTSIVNVFDLNGKKIAP